MELQEEISGTASYERDESFVKSLDAECFDLVVNDILKAFLNVAEIGCAVDEVWLVHNAATSLWNFNYHSTGIGNKQFIDVLRKILPFLKKVNLGR